MSKTKIKGSELMEQKEDTRIVAEYTADLGFGFEVDDVYEGLGVFKLRKSYAPVNNTMTSYAKYQGYYARHVGESFVVFEKW